MNVKSTLQIRDSVRVWATGDGADLLLTMPSGAGSMTARQIIETIDTGGPSPDGDYTAEELVDVLTTVYLNLPAINRHSSKPPQSAEKQSPPAAP